MIAAVKGKLSRMTLVAGHLRVRGIQAEVRELVNLGRDVTRRVRPERLELNVTVFTAPNEDPVW